VARPYHYRVDENGLIEWANLIIATGHNNLAMNRGVLESLVVVHGTEIQESMLNRVEAVIRCLTLFSCRPMPWEMPLNVQLIGPTAGARRVG